MNKKIVKICVFDKNSTPSKVIGFNGDAILDNICTQCETDENLETGEYYLDATFIVDDDGDFNYLEEESILKVTMDYGEEIFRIAKLTKTSKNIVVFARQITISETLDMWLEDVRPENQSGLGAITWIKDNSKGKKDITVYSDIDTIATAYYMDMNMYEALHDCDQSFMNRWGGEIQRRGYKLCINKRIGSHRGVQIRRGKNLTGFEGNTDIDNVVTRIKPKGYDGITIDGYVESPLINNYSAIKTKTIKYDDIKVKDPEAEDDEGYDTLEEAQTELIRRANLEFTQNNIDKIQADYRINFIQLEQTEEYKDYVSTERIFLGDEIDVFEEKLNINITVRAIRKRFDVLKQKTIEIELSNEVVKTKVPTIGDIINQIDKIEGNMNESFENILNQAKDHATDLINSGLKDSYVVVRQNEILIMDTQDINTAVNVWRWNRGGLGFSSTGYNGQFSTAITNDGKIVADFITTGVLNAVLIKAGILKSFNQKTWIDMENGTFNFADKIKFDGTTFSVDISGEDLSTNESMKSILKILDDSISSKVSNSDFSSYKEQTANSINSKVSNSDFSSYKEQTAYEISQRVSAGDVSSIIKQDAESVKIGFNNISDSFLVNEHGILCNNINGNKSIAIQKGNLYYYNQYDNSKFLGGIIPRITTSDYLKGFGVLASKHCNTFQISHTDQWDNDSQWEIPGTIYPDFWINYKDITSYRGDLKGIHLGMTTYADGNILGNKTNSISGFNSIASTSSCFDYWRSLIDNSIVARFDGGTNQILLGKNLNGNGFVLENFSSINSSNIYLDNVYAYNGNYGRLLFRTNGWDMFNGANWDWQGYNILNPRIVGGVYGYSAINNSTKSCKTDNVDDVLDSINIIVEDVSTYAEGQTNSLEIDVSQLINHPKADLFIDKETNNVNMKSMLHLALLEIQKLKKECMDLRCLLFEKNE